MEFTNFKESNDYEGLYRVTASAANIRKEPGINKNNQVIKTVMRGTKFELSGEYKMSGSDKWFEVKIGDDTGYILDKIIEKLD